MFKSLTKAGAAVWPNVGLKISRNFTKVAQNVTMSVYTYDKNIFKVAQKISHMFKPFLPENLLTKPLEKSPIWSPCSKWTFNLILIGLNSIPGLDLILGFGEIMKSWPSQEWVNVSKLLAHAITITFYRLQRRLPTSPFKGSMFYFFGLYLVGSLA